MTTGRTGILGTVVLAAGAGRRFGAEAKLLADLEGYPLVAWSLCPFTRRDLARRLLVVADIQGEIARIGRLMGFEIVVNPQADEGMGRSLACGLAALSADGKACDLDGVFVALADMPTIALETLSSLARTFTAETDCTVLAPVHKGWRGHPVLFARDLFPDLAACSGDEGARSVIAAAGESTGFLDCDDPGILLDVDTQDGLEIARSALLRTPASFPRPW